VLGEAAGAARGVSSEAARVVAIDAAIDVVAIAMLPLASGLRSLAA